MRQVASRDRLAFSKSILRRFIRDCVDRDAAVASPWTVKPAIAARYGVNTVMPDEIRVGVETIKKGEIDKRKKVWEDKEGPAQKKRRQMAEEKGTSVVDPAFSAIEHNNAHRSRIQPKRRRRLLWPLQSGGSGRSERE